MNTNEKFVITISREVGSGGRTVGRKLAEKLGVRYCDKQLIDKLVDTFGLSVENIERIKGEKKNWLTDILEKVSPVPQAGAVGSTVNIYQSETIGDRVFRIESEILMQLAEEGSCVIAGRSGFFVLRNCPNKVDVFITASPVNRVKRVMEKQNLSEKEAEEVIAKVDKMRENYVSHYSGKSRYDSRNYDLVINMDNISEDGAVELILNYINYGK